MPTRVLPLTSAGLAVVEIVSTADHVVITSGPHQPSAICPACAQVSQRLHLLLRHESLAGVLDDAARTLLADFAASMQWDLPAVQAVLDLPWTTSPGGGQINRIKTIKRSMYGRASFQLLRARVLYAA